MSATPSAETGARREAARALAEQGRMLEAEHAFTDLLRDVPDDGDALNFLAICAHERRRFDEAIGLLERAHRAHPDDATTLTNLGVLHRERGQLDAAHAALHEAVGRAPEFFVARLRLGEVLEALGRADQALPAYFGAMVTAQNRGQWISDATTPPGLRPLVLHAVRVVAEGRRRLFSALLQPLRDRHGSAPLARVERCLAMYLGDLRIEYRTTSGPNAKVIRVLEPEGATVKNPPEIDLRIRGKVGDVDVHRV